MDFDDHQSEEDVKISQGFNSQSQGKFMHSSAVAVAVKVHFEYSTEFPVIPVEKKGDLINWAQIISMKKGPGSQVLGNQQEKKVFSGEVDKFSLSCPDVDNLVRLITGRTDSIKVKQMEKTFLDGKNQKGRFSRVNCRTCKRLLVQVDLKCRHLTCFSCFCRNVRRLLQNPNMMTLKPCRCKTCFEFYSVEDVQKYLEGDLNEIQQFKKLEIMKTCLWCKRNLNVLQEFCPELECFHICRLCYTNELFIYVKSCLVCNSEYKNKEISYQREASCLLCGKKGKILGAGYWCFHKDHYLCFSCHQQNLNQLIKNLKCPGCQQSFDKTSLSIFAYFINKICIGCKDFISVADGERCSNCCNFSCEKCLVNQKCLICG